MVGRWCYRIAPFVIEMWSLLPVPSARLPSVQDIVYAVGWVKTALSDVGNVLLELDDDDLGELAQVGG